MFGILLPRQCQTHRYRCDLVWVGEFNGAMGPWVFLEELPFWGCQFQMRYTCRLDRFDSKPGQARGRVMVLTSQSGDSYSWKMMVSDGPKN